MLKVWRYLSFIVLGAVIFGCGKSQLASTNKYQALTDNWMYLSGNSVARVYYVTSDSNPGLFVTELDTTKGELKLPGPLYDSIDYGSRRNPSTPQSLDLILRLYRDPVETGDFYFETPILAPTVGISNTSTAVSWILRWSFGSNKIKVSADFFNQIVDSAEVICSDCRKKTTTEVVEFILRNDFLKQNILEKVKLQNSDLVITNINYQPPGLIYAGSAPNLIDNGVTTKDVNEGENFSVDLKMVNPLFSSQLVRPFSWHHVFNTVMHGIALPLLSYDFNYLDAGKHDFLPQFGPSVVYDQVTFTAEVMDANRIPICEQPLTIPMKANRRSKFDLATKCYDPDTDEHSLVYVQSSAPPGLLISALGLIDFTPPAHADGLPYNANFSFVVNDSKLGRRTAYGTIAVMADNLPVFDNLPVSLNVTEGVQSSFNFKAHDPDGDPIKIKITPVDPIDSSAPVGSGDLTNVNCNLVAGIYNCQWIFQPSWMQVLGQDGTARVKFSIFYDSAIDDSLNGSIELQSQVVTLNIKNTDDPPVFVEQPTDISVKEGTEYSVALGNAIDIGKAIDSPVNPTTVSYSGVVSGLNCDWIKDSIHASVDGRIIFEGTPPLNSAGSCGVMVLAQDENGLSSQSSEFNILVEDTNSPVTTKPDSPNSVMGFEGQALTIHLVDYFDDYDKTILDPRETWTFDCKWDDVGSGIYDKECDSQNPGTTLVKFGFINSNYTAVWVPTSGVGGRDYPVQFTVTDKGGTTATKFLLIHINESPSPMLLDMTLNGVDSETNISTSENTQIYFTLRARAPSDRAIDQYNYKISAPACFKVGGGLCRASLIGVPGQLTGNGDQDFVFSINTLNNYTDGDAALPDSQAKYMLNFSLEDLDGLQLTTDLTIPVTINNTDRLPTGITVSAKNESCVGSSVPDSTNNDFTICIDASKDTKNGSLWTKTYSLDFIGVDPDGSNDQLSFSFPSTTVPGSITANRWSFKLPSCVNTGISTINRTFSLKLDDGRGGSFQRKIILKIIKASAGGICMQ